MVDKTLTIQRDLIRITNGMGAWWGRITRMRSIPDVGWVMFMALSLNHVSYWTWVQVFCIEGDPGQVLSGRVLVALWIKGLVMSTVTSVLLYRHWFEGDGVVRNRTIGYGVAVLGGAFWWGGILLWWFMKRDMAQTCWKAQEEIEEVMQRK